ncbi:MAG TPA: hypothetical protein VE912_20015, partial [Bacteroidales bacterium]|nr:hypothetical protein [Bacteroidales bacterium]
MKRSDSIFLLVVFVFFTTACNKQNKDVISLKGDWRFAIDTADTGFSSGWFQQKLPETVHLPGSMKENGKGFVPTLKTLWT